MQDTGTFVVGVDGGTTKTIALVANEQGNILGVTRGGGSNWIGEIVETPMAVVVDTVRKALEIASLAGSQVEAGVFCLAGADWPLDHIRRQVVLEQAGLARRVIVKNDTFAGLRVGISRPYEMVIAAGSGVNAAVITPDGQEWAFGYYAAYGGAATIAREALTAVLRAEDGRGPPTLLTSIILQMLDFFSVDHLLRASVMDEIPYYRLMALCPVVFEAALAGDPAATEIITHQAKALAEYATAMTRRFKMGDMAFEVVLSGSVFKGVGSLLIDTIASEIHRVSPGAVIVRPRFEPAVGSLLLAYDLLGLPVTQAIESRLKLTLPEEAFFATTDGIGVADIR